VTIQGATTLVSPDSVRVWRGFRLRSLSLDAFYSGLGTVFVPATVKMQVAAGLHSYTPTVPAGLPGKPDTVPDETAILFWESQATYWNAFTRLAVRTYTLTHNGVYDTANQRSRADFPVPFSGALGDQPAYLYDQPADWMRGAIRHLVAGRADKQDAAGFRADVSLALTKIREQVRLQGAIAYAGDDYVVYWELGPIAPGVPPAQVPSGVPLLQAAVGWNQVFAPAPTHIPVGLWDEWSGMDVRAGSSFSMQFERRVNA
jgi:hypothetical protein